MKAAIALLADYQIQNIARQMVFEMSQRAELEFFGSLLPAHVSLKQPFRFEHIKPLENWFDSLAARINPFEINLDSIYYSQWNDYAILGFNVAETPTLRNLHNQINRELAVTVKDPSAPFDGEEYRFHLTIETGKIGKANPYKAFYESLPDHRVDLNFCAAYLGMFFYADRSIRTGSFILYRVMPLGISTDAMNDRK